MTELGISRQGTCVGLPAHGSRATPLRPGPCLRHYYRPEHRLPRLQKWIKCPTKKALGKIRLESFRLGLRAHALAGGTKMTVSCDAEPRHPSTFFFVSRNTNTWSLLNLAPSYYLRKPRGEREFRLPIPPNPPYSGPLKPRQMLIVEVRSKSHRGRHVSYRRRHIALCHRSPLNIATQSERSDRMGLLGPLSVRSYLSRNPAP